MRNPKERGAALVEFALIVPILAFLCMGVIDYGDAWFRSTSAESGVRAAAVTSYDAADDYDHDIRVLRSVVSEFRNRGIENLEYVIIFNSAADGQVPQSCIDAGSAGITGVFGVCIKYNSDFLSTVFTDVARNKFVACGNPTQAGCPTSADSLWQAESRSPTGGGDPSWRVGIHVQAEQETMTGFLPGFRTYNINKSAIIKEWPHD